MPFTTEQLSYAGKAAIDFYLKNDPVDQINTDRPLLKMLMAKKKAFPGAKQYVVEQLRKSNSANFQWFNGDDEVNYNRKRTLEQAQFAWSGAHDGFALNEDELLQNGIIMTDERTAVPTEAERMQLTNLMKENTETLKLGFQEKFDYALHLDGTQDADAIPGLDLLVSTDPTTGIVGGINRATAGNEWWRNNFQTGINTGTADALTTAMEAQWRASTRYGGFAPDFIICGSKFLDAYRADAKDTVNRQIILQSGKGTDMDASVGLGARTGLYFKGVEVLWDPVLDQLEADLNPTIPYDKRCYFLNTRFMTLRPAQGHDMVVRRPPRVYNRYTHYWGLTFKGVLTINKPNAMSVLSIA